MTSNALRMWCGGISPLTGVLAPWKIGKRSNDRCRTMQRGGGEWRPVPACNRERGRRVQARAAPGGNFGVSERGTCVDCWHRAARGKITCRAAWLALRLQMWHPPFVFTRISGHIYAMLVTVVQNMRYACLKNMTRLVGFAFR